MELRWFACGAQHNLCYAASVNAHFHAHYYAHYNAHYYARYYAHWSLCLTVVCLHAYYYIHWSIPVPITVPTSMPTSMPAGPCQCPLPCPLGPSMPACNTIATRLAGRRKFSQCVALLVGQFDMVWKCGARVV